MKRLSRLFGALLLPVFAVSVLVSCDDDKTEPTDYPTEILQFSFNGETLVTTAPVVDQEAATVKFTVSSEANKTSIKLTPAITLSPECTVSPASGEEVDFASPVTYKVTSKITGASKDYTVTCTRDLYQDALILEMSVAETFVEDHDNITLPEEGSDIILYVPYYTTDEQLASITPSFVISDGADIDPASGRPQDFSDGQPIKYTVTAEVGGDNFNEYFVSVERRRNTEAVLERAWFEDAEGEPLPYEVVVNEEGKTVTISLPYGETPSVLADAVLRLEISDDASSTPEDGTVADFTGENPTITVVSGDEQTETPYSVVFNQMANTEAALLSIEFEEAQKSLLAEPVTIAAGDREVYVRLVPEADEQAVASDIFMKFTVSPDAKIVKMSDETEMDLVNGNRLDLYGEDGFVFRVYSAAYEESQSEEDYTDYKIFVVRNKYTGAEMTSFEITAGGDKLITQPLFVTRDNGEVDIIMHVDEGSTDSDASSLQFNIVIDEGASSDPMNLGSVSLSGLNQPYAITVTAEDPTYSTVYNIICRTLEVTHYGFETWSQTGSGASQRYEPGEGWATPNQGATNFGNDWMQAKGFPASRTEDSKSGDYAILLQSKDSRDAGGLAGSLNRNPGLTAGSSFLGTFSITLAGMLEPLKSSSFGIEYLNKKPIRVRGYYKYTPGDLYLHNKDVSEDGEIDAMAISTVLYEVSSMKETLDGTNIDNSSKRVAWDKLSSDETVTEYTFFELDLSDKYVRDYDPGLLYKFTVMLSASVNGASFYGAAGSTLIVDDIEIIYADYGVNE